MAKLTESQWGEVRHIWESDSSVSFAVMAKRVGIGKSTLIDRCKKFEWAKSDTSTDGFYLDADYSFLGADRNNSRPSIKPTVHKADRPKNRPTDRKTSKVDNKKSSKASKQADLVEKNDSKVDNESVANKTALTTTEAKESNGIGRPTLYKDEYAELVFNYCLLGATDSDLAVFFNVTEQTVNNWKISHPDFFEAMQNGKYKANADVVGAVYKSAIGSHYIEEEKVIGGGGEEGNPDIVTIKRQIAPNVTAQQYILNNRRPKDWKSKVEVKEEINLNVFPPKEVLDAIYDKALKDAAERDKMLIGRRERLGIVLDHDAMEGS